GKQVDRLQKGNARDGCPCALGFRFPSAIHGEVNEMLPIRRQIATALVNPPAHPLANLERVALAIPQYCANRLRRPATNYQPDLRISREQDVQARGKFATLFWRLWHAGT